MNAFPQKEPISPFSNRNFDLMKPHFSAQLIDFRKLIPTETPLETFLLDLPEFRIGLNWGVPRFGHPEGKVGYHVVEVLQNISAIPADPLTRQRLRIAAIAHDTFKNLESESIEKGNRINHGLLARQFMEAFTDDTHLLDLIELHDEIYYAWRHEALQFNSKLAENRLRNLLERTGDQLRLHYLFFRCDTLTGDKIQAPRHWFERKLVKTEGADMRHLIDRLNAR